MEKIAIISRSFWPVNPAIGEALLILSESLATKASPVVITQVDKNFHNILTEKKRGLGVKFLTLPSFTNSSSPIPFRILELIIFTFFVFFSLCRLKIDKVYVATNPPLFTPLIVRWYCTLFNKKYVYHLQDIHPEATQVVTGKESFFSTCLKRIDIKTTKKATLVITLTNQMKDYINKRTAQDLPIVLLNNPSVQLESAEKCEAPKRLKGFVYCGNAGRLQRIPLLLQAIRKYLNEGGKLPFVFAGGGVYQADIEQLASEFDQVSYLGILNAGEAAKLLNKYDFGLMPIEDSVTNFAFPSKSSSYVFAGCQIVAICSKNTSVGTWVTENNLGFVSSPVLEDVTDLFHQLEKSHSKRLEVSSELLESFTPQAHAKKLEQFILEDMN